MQEIFLLLGDKLAPVSKKWWYVLVAAFIFVIPSYFLLKSMFVNLLVGSYQGPQLINISVVKEPLQVIDKKILALPNNTYYGYIKIRNINLEWGVAGQAYTVNFRTLGGTVVNTANRMTFILPASEKLIVLPRFTSDKRPEELLVSLPETHFVRKPQLVLNFDKQRTNLNNQATGLVVSSAFINLSPFIIKQVDLPVTIYNSQNQIVAVNFTYINDVKSSETRTFQYSWPALVADAVRAEINPELNVFDRNIISNVEGTPQF